jgi:hypothetical protein
MPLNRQQVLIRKGRRRSTLHPKCVFRLAALVVCKGAWCHNGKNTKVTKPGVDLGAGTQASTATTSNTEQPVVEIASSYDDEASSSEESEEGSDESSSSDKTSTSASSDEDDVQSDGPAGSR